MVTVPSPLPPSKMDFFLWSVPRLHLFSVLKYHQKRKWVRRAHKVKMGRRSLSSIFFFSHRPICRGTASLSQPRSRVLKRRNDQGRVSLINISLQLRFDCASKLPVAHHLMNKNWKYDPCISWWGQESAFIFTFLKKLQAPLLEKLFVRVIYTRNLHLKRRSLCTRDCFMETARALFIITSIEKRKREPGERMSPLLLMILRNICYER